MSNKLLSAVIIIVLFIGILTIFARVVYAKSSNLLCSKKQDIIVTLRDDADIEKSKEQILKIPQIKITKITDRNKEWSKMVNKYDLPRMENPFKNEFVIKTKRNANIDEIINQLKEMAFIEKAEYVSDADCAKK